MNKYRTVLSIAGSDSIGGAGIQADIKTCCSIGVYAMTAITALTSQNTMGVRAVMPTPADVLRSQLDAIFEDVTPDAVKIGMIPNSECAEVIADVLEKFLPEKIVIDPVMIATSGDSLSSESSIKVLKNRLLPLASIVTPNIPEAEALTGLLICQKGDIKEAANHILNEYCCQSVLIKGGHFCPEDTLITDYFLHHESTEVLFNRPRIDTKNTHGTGCSLSSAIASYLAKGHNITNSVKFALQWEFKAIRNGADYIFGHGHGPINHIYKTLNSPNK